MSVIYNYFCCNCSHLVTAYICILTASRNAQDYTPKISDFGLAKFGPQDDRSHTSSRVLGTKGYFAPEYVGTGTNTAQFAIFFADNSKILQSKEQYMED